ncbi:MAG: hypothetical protein Kow0063_31840 [Anaerolineae bacterium]
MNQEPESRQEQISQTGGRAGQMNRARFSYRHAYLCLVIAIGFGLRVAKLDSLPLSLGLDEAINGIDALRLWRAGHLTSFLQNNFGRETLFFYLQALALQLYGISIFSLRLAPVLSGTLTIPLLYATGQRLLRSNRLALPRSFAPDIASMLAATGLATSYWHIYFSRVALRGILLPLLLLGVIWCFWQGWGTGRGLPAARRRRWLAAAGFLLGLTLYTYLAARLLPLLFAAFFILELGIDRSSFRRTSVDFLVFTLTSALTAIPLARYFYLNPQALSGRTQALSILAGDSPLNALSGNLAALLRIHFLGGTWLGQWPALNLLSAAGFLIGLGICLYQIKRAACRFLLLWWSIGVVPMLLSQQNWEATTTILRSVVAWPALFLISALGLTTLVSLSVGWITRLGRERPGLRSESRLWILAPLFILLFFSGLTSIYNYFHVWSTRYNQRRSDDALHLARYLNSQNERAVLTPLSVYNESVINFLLQARYSNLSTLDAQALRTYLALHPAGAVYLVPGEGVSEATFVLLVPAPAGSGTAYLLSPLPSPKLDELLTHTQAMLPLSTIRNGQQEPVARIYPLTPNTPFLPDVPAPWQPTQANFDNHVWLTGYYVEPGVVKPGEPVRLYLKWQSQGLVDGDYYVFLHLFDVLQAGRRGQANSPLNNIVYRAATPLTFFDTYRFQLPPESPEGVYLFEMGLYHNFSLERLPVIINGANPSRDDKVILGKFRVQQEPPAPPQYSIQAQFGGGILLLGGDFPKGSLHPGETLTYTLYWQALDSIDRDYTVFNHVLDGAGMIRAQQDSMPQENRYPTSMWDAGEIVMDTYAIPLAPDIEPGDYTLRIGLYEPETGQRLPLKDKARDFVELPDLIRLEW